MENKYSQSRGRVACDNNYRGISWGTALVSCVHQGCSQARRIFFWIWGLNGFMWFAYTAAVAVLSYSILILSCGAMAEMENLRLCLCSVLLTSTPYGALPPSSTKNSAT